MFDDILTNDSNYKEEEEEEHCIDTCDCDECVEAAIKNIATKLKLALEDEDVEIIKKEYFTDPCKPISKWLEKKFKNLEEEVI